MFSVALLCKSAANMLAGEVLLQPFTVLNAKDMGRSFAGPPSLLCKFAARRSISHPPPTPPRETTLAEKTFHARWLSVIVGPWTSKPPLRCWRQVSELVQRHVNAKAVISEVVTTAKSLMLAVYGVTHPSLQDPTALASNVPGAGAGAGDAGGGGVRGCGGGGGGSRGSTTLVLGVGWSWS